LASHRRVDRTRRLALPFRLLFAVAVVGLCGGVLFAATGGMGKVAETLGATFTGFFSDLTATPLPSVEASDLSDTPLLDDPGEPYTNQPTIDLVGSIPTALVGTTGNELRIYVAIGDQRPGIVTQIPVGRTPRFVVPGVTLIEGTNTFSATILGPNGESERSPVVTYVFDATKPRITLSSPKNGAIVNAKTVLLVGETQPRSEMRIRNASTNAIVTGQADASGKFSISLPIGDGTNDIGVTAIDPAGNENHLVLAVRKGSGTLVAALSASPYSIRLSSLPEPATITVLVSDPDGRPLEDAQVTFVIAAKGVSAVTKTFHTGGDGTARWVTNIPKGANTGQVSVTVVVKTTKYGETTARTVITIVK
jgi:Bacterial Ig domain/Macroglobulin domain MG4